MVEPPPDPKRQRLDEEEVDEGEQALAADADADGTGSLYPAELGVEDSVFEQYGTQQEFLDKVSTDRIPSMFDLGNSWAPRAAPAAETLTLLVLVPSSVLDLSR